MPTHIGLIVEEVNDMYNLKVNKEQLEIIADALDSYSRLKCGQLKSISDLFFDKKFDRNDLDYAMTQTKIILFPELQNSQYLGIYQQETPSDAKISYDVYKIIKNEFNKDSKPWNVHCDPHIMLAGNYPVGLEEVIDI